MLLSITYSEAHMGQIWQIILCCYVVEGGLCYIPVPKQICL